MKLKVFFASDGDCLLLSSRDGRHALIDGGRSGTFQKEAWPVLRDLSTIDLLIVSHIDSDHISGILWLTNLLAEWELFDHQRGPGANPDIRAPKEPRPPKIERFWHNAWRAQLGDLAGPIEGQISDVAATDGHARDLAVSIPEGVELMRTVEHATPLDRNADFGGGLVIRKSPPKVVELGTTSLTVLGPGRKDLERLREEWRKWLEQAPTGPEEAATIIPSVHASQVTPPNRASITLLAEEDGRTCLLTGDAGEPELLDGLKAARKLSRGRFRCNVLKVQHHGARDNLSVKFARAVLADHYVFCADGNHHNPEPDVVKTIAETRTAEDPGRPFTLWFNCTPSRTRSSRRDAMRAAIEEAKAAARAHPEITVEVLERRAPFFELTV
jgi:hypothetical protein